MVLVTHADGTTSRWGAGERKTEDTPSGISFSTAVPGGFTTATFRLPRGLTKTYQDESLFDTVSILGPGNRVAWQGRVAQLPREHGDSQSVQVGCVGLSAKLRDSATFREIYADCDLSRWQGVTLARRYDLVTGNYTATDPSVVWDETGPALATIVLGESTATSLPDAEALYDSQGVPIGSIYYGWKRHTNTNNADTNWSWKAILATDAQYASFDDSGDLRAAGPGSGTLTATTSTRVYAMVQATRSAALTGTENAENGIYWTSLRVAGTHGLTLRGSGVGAGFYVSDIVRDIVTRECPDLLIAEIADNSFIIPHLVFDSPVSAEDAIASVNAYALNRYGAYEDGFFWRPPDPDRLTWEARISDGAKLALEGDADTSVFTGVVVQYTDTDGRARTVGPTGYSPADWTDDDLLITDETNPAVAHGVRRYGVLNVSSPLRNANSDGDRPAVQIGRMWLAEQSLPSRRGSITLPYGSVKHPTEGVVAPWRCRAGEWVRVADRPGDVAREITSTDYDDDSQTVTLTVGGLPNKVEAMLLSLGVNMVGVA